MYLLKIKKIVRKKKFMVSFSEFFCIVFSQASIILLSAFEALAWLFSHPNFFTKLVETITN